jgi:hypothetical protein
MFIVRRDEKLVSEILQELILIGVLFNTLARLFAPTWSSMLAANFAAAGDAN